MLTQGLLTDLLHGNTQFFRTRLRYQPGGRPGATE